MHLQPRTSGDFRPVNDPREIFGWAMYDWANSGFQTTVVTVMSGPYLTALAQHEVGENGVVLSLGPLVVTAKSLFPYCISLSVFLQALLLPMLGAIADYTNLKKRLMTLFCYVGSVATCRLSRRNDHSPVHQHNPSHPRRPQPTPATQSVTCLIQSRAVVVATGIVSNPTSRGRARRSAAEKGQRLQSNPASPKARLSKSARPTVAAHRIR